MVLPWPIVEAAETGDVTTVREWLESGGDPNDRSITGRSNALIAALAGPDEISEAHVDVVRLLIARGADVNCGASDGFAPLHCCTVYPEYSSYGPIIGLLLEAGANVHATTSDGETPLGMALDCSIWTGPDESRACLDMVTRLLRAGAALDFVQRNEVTAEKMLLQEEERLRLVEVELTSHFYACKALISDLRAAGSWKSYVRATPKELLRLRSLVARGRAREKKRLRAKTPREIALLFAPTFPNELFWNVATYWNPRS